MGFYHHLNVKKQDGEIIDVGGYSKGGTIYAWYFLFSPTEHFDNLEQFVGEEIATSANRFEVGYKTSVDKAMQRISQANIALVNLQESMLDYNSQLFISDSLSVLHELSRQLRDFKGSDILELDQRDGASYALVIKGDKILGIADWHNKTAIDTQLKLKSFQAVNGVPSAVIASYLPYLPNKEFEDFSLLLKDLVNHDERSFGSDFYTQSILEIDTSKAHLNNPHSYFSYASKKLLDALELEADTPISTTDQKAVEISNHLNRLYYDSKYLFDRQNNASFY